MFSTTRARAEFREIKSFVMKKCEWPEINSFLLWCDNTWFLVRMIDFTKNDHMQRQINDKSSKYSELAYSQATRKLVWNVGSETTACQEALDEENKVSPDNHCFALLLKTVWETGHSLPYPDMVSFSRMDTLCPQDLLKKDRTSSRKVCTANFTGKASKVRSPTKNYDKNVFSGEFFVLLVVVQHLNNCVFSWQSHC